MSGARRLSVRTPAGMAPPPRDVREEASVQPRPRVIARSFRGRRRGRPSPGEREPASSRVPGAVHGAVGKGQQLLRFARLISATGRCRRLPRSAVAGACTARARQPARAAGVLDGSNVAPTWPDDRESIAPDARDHIGIAPVPGEAPRQSSRTTRPRLRPARCGRSETGSGGEAFVPRCSPSPTPGGFRASA